MIDVVCVMWGDKFSDIHVQTLKAMVERNTTIEHDFICFSDREIEGIKTRQLPTGFKGWWNKMFLFSDEAMLNERVVYLDLDTMITDNIDWLLTYEGNFMGIEDLGVNNHKYEDVRKYQGKMQSGVMSWNSRECYDIWEAFDANKEVWMEKYRGDGEFLNDLVDPTDLLQHKFPNKLRSYKYECYENGLPEGTSIVCFHGEPSPEQAINETVKPWGTVYEPREWVADYWRL
jgi:hypothetical protein